eukprot:1830039-Rhodomonas_salina.1
MSGTDLGYAAIPTVLRGATFAMQCAVLGLGMVLRFRCAMFSTEMRECSSTVLYCTYLPMRSGF